MVHKRATEKRSLVSFSEDQMKDSSHFLHRNENSNDEKDLVVLDDTLRFLGKFS